ncbi:MAG: DoxX family protein [Flavobacteriales bacterium]|nr:DoxX family protein [Flavobacteriales bacterium]
MDLTTTAYALLFVRVSLGILFLFQAIDKIFTVGLKEFTSTILSGMKKDQVPPGFIRFSAYVSSYIELVGGVFLILGLFLPEVYIILALNLIMVILSFSYMQALWDLKHVFPRMVLLVFLMIMSHELDLYSLDHFFFH